MGLGLSARTGTAAVLLAAAGCGTGADQPAVLVQITPPAANNDAPVSVVIYGMSFRPAYHFDVVSGNTGVDLDGFNALFSPSTFSPPTNVEVPLSAVVWEADNMLQATVPARIAMGTYDLVVRDPRGQSSRLPEAFASLGPDQTPPVVTISSPLDDSIVGAQAQVAVVVQADDGMGQVVGLQVNVRTDMAPVLTHDCSAAAAAKAACTFSFPAPAPTSNAAVLYIDATAIDGGGNIGTAETVVELVPAPVATSLSPATGSSSGGTFVTVVGANFLPLTGATGVMFDGVFGGVTEVSPTSLMVSTPAHAAGRAVVTVEIGGTSATVPGGFLYVDPAIVREISPSYGPPTGGTAVKVVGDNFTAMTQILIGETVLVGSVFQNANLIEGITPPGTGEASIGAYDPILDGQTFGPATFSYGADGGVPLGSEGGLSDGGVSIPYPRYPIDGGTP